MRRDALAQFLRARRAALTPEAVGWPTGRRRRTAGLRREEVAALAGVSVSWYTWLEQGRPVNASDDVLDALARALRLDPVEHAHLLALAGHGPRRTQPAGAASGELPAHLLRLLAGLEPDPAYVLSPSWQVLASNDAHRRLFPPVASVPPEERNLVWLVFVHPEARGVISDWESEARRVLSQFRADIAGHHDDADVQALVARLTEASPEFAAWWPRHDVAGFATRIRAFDHPVAGHLRFEHLVLVPSSATDLRIVVHLPIEGDDSAERLAAVPLPTAGPDHDTTSAARSVSPGGPS